MNPHPYKNGGKFGGDSMSYYSMKIGFTSEGIIYIRWKMEFQDIMKWSNYGEEESRMKYCLYK